LVIERGLFVNKSVFSLLELETTYTRLDYHNNRIISCNNRGIENEIIAESNVALFM